MGRQPPYKVQSNKVKAGITNPRGPGKTGRSSQWSASYNQAALDSRAGFRKRCGGRFLYEIVKNGSASDGNQADDKACHGECAHRDFSCFPQLSNTFINSRCRWRIKGLPEIGYSSREGKGLRFDIHESSPQQAHAGVKIRRFSLLQIDKKAPDPGSELFFEDLTIATGRTENTAANQPRHDLAKNGGVILGLRMPFRS